MRNISETRSGEITSSQDAIRKESTVEKIKEPTAEEIKAMSSEELGKYMSGYWPALRVFFANQSYKKNPHFDPEDLIQNTYIKVLENLENFRGKSSFKNWLFAIATNIFFDKYRKESRRSFKEISRDAPTRNLPRSFDTPDSDSVSFARILQNKSEVEKIMQMLTPQEALLFRLRYIEEIESKEIAKRLGEPESTIKVKIFRARQKVLKSLGMPNSNN